LAQAILAQVPFELKKARTTSAEVAQLREQWQ